MSETNRVKLDHFVVVSGMSWGKDKDLETAFWNWFKNERPRDTTTVHVRQTDSEAYVDGMGTLYAARETIKLPSLILSKSFLKKYEDVMGDLEELLEPAQNASDLDAAYDGVERIK